MKRKAAFQTVASLMLSGLLCLSACSQATHKPFDPKTCLENVPSRVKGLEILAGSRSKKSIIRDMVPSVCNGRVLFKKMEAQGLVEGGGDVLFRVRVENTGEVQSVDVQKTTLQSEAFLKQVSDFIMDTDFVFGMVNGPDTVFLYPINFGR